MKNNYNAGDKVILIYCNEKDKTYTISKEVIESVSLYVDKVEYYLEGSCCDPIEESELYMPDKAIEFLSNYINKND